MPRLKDLVLNLEVVRMVDRDLDDAASQKGSEGVK